MPMTTLVHSKHTQQGSGTWCPLPSWEFLPAVSLIRGHAFEEKDAGGESRGLAPLKLGSPPTAPLTLEHRLSLQLQVGRRSPQDSCGSGQCRAECP